MNDVMAVTAPSKSAGAEFTPLVEENGVVRTAESPVVLHDDVPHTTFRSMMTDVGNMLKAFIGLNFMYVAYAFAQAGLVRGIVGLVFIALVTEHCCLLLVDVKDAMPPQVLARTGGKPPTYGDIARFVGGRPCEMVINAALILTQFGYCVGYLIFISGTVHDLLQSKQPTWLFVIMPVPVLISLAMLRSIRSLGPFSLFANAALLTGFIAVVVFIAKHFEWQPSTPGWGTFPLFFGQMTAALEGIGLVIPVETSMKNRANFPLVLRISLFILITILMTVGILGFVTFGSETRSILLLNFGQSPVVNIVKTILIFGILFTYPLQIVPVFQLVEVWLMKKTEKAKARRNLRSYSSGDVRTADAEIELGIITDDNSEYLNGQVTFPSPIRGSTCLSGTHEERQRLNAQSDALDAPESETVPIERRERFVRDPMKIAFRLAIVLATAITAMVAGTSFGLFQSLVGSMGAACLAYSAPAFFHLKVFGSQMNPAEKAKDWFIFVFGVSGAVIGTTATLYEIIKARSGHTHAL